MSEKQLAEAVKTRKFQHQIGKDARADRIRGWLAQAVEEGTALLLDPQGLEWMGPEERALARLRLRLLQAQTPEQAAALRATLDCEEAKGAVMTWASENEEPPRKEEMTVLRKEKRAQMRTARHRVWKKLGTGSLNAAILMLLLQGVAFPEVDPAPDWIQNAAAWAHTHQWSELTREEMVGKASASLKTTRDQLRHRDGCRSWHTLLDLGEGWGSIGIAAASMNCSTIGVDIAGVVYQGTLHGQIRARVQIDFAEQRETNLLRRIAKKAWRCGSPRSAPCCPRRTT